MTTIPPWLDFAMLFFWIATLAFVWLRRRFPTSVRIVLTLAAVCNLLVIAFRLTTRG